MSKRLKRRIHEICGFENLKKEERLKRAYEILNSTELKQAICNQILGAKFKDVASAMRAITNERQPSKEEQERLEIMEISPEKLEPQDFLPKSKKNNATMYKTLTMAEAQELIAASKASFEVPEPKPFNMNYHTYSQEEVEEMVAEYYSYDKNKVK